MTTTHTPGPWTISKPSLRHMEAMITASADHPMAAGRNDVLAIAHVDNVDGFGTHGIGESAANARLIAAAPRLAHEHAELRQLVNRLAYEPVGHPEASLDALIAEARVLLAKLDGKE